MVRRRKSQEEGIGQTSESFEPAYLVGRKGVAELLCNRPEIIKEIRIAEGIRLSPELEQLIEGYRSSGGGVRSERRSTLDSLFGEESHQGVVAALAAARRYSHIELAEIATAPGATGLLVVLDQVVDPRNLGTLLRLCDAVGVDGVCITSDRSAGITGVVRKASMGASELVPIAIVGNLHRVLLDLKQRGFWIVGTALEDGAGSLFNQDFPGPIAVVFGSEGKGMRELTRKSCDLLVSIPMVGNVQSLNVSQAAAVVLYEIVRKRGGLAQY